MGYFTIKKNNWRIQFYYPTFRLKKPEIFIKLDIVFRIFFDNDYICAGFEFLGFGIGFDKDKRQKSGYVI